MMRLLCYPEIHEILKNSESLWTAACFVKRRRLHGSSRQV
jgi:hypothetical protein